MTAARVHLSELVSKVETGEEVVITRYGRPVVRMVPATQVKQPFPLQRLAALRKRIYAQTKNSTELLPKPLKPSKPVPRGSVLVILRNGKK